MKRGDQTKTLAHAPDP